MADSMTGFGRAEYTDEERKITVELRSVNHRFLDIGVKLPRKIGRFETKIRNVIREYAVRGKIDCFFTYTSLTSGGSEVVYNRDVAEQYVTYLQELQQRLGTSEEMKAVSVASFPGVFTLEEKTDVQDSEYAYLEKVLREACENFQHSRQTEGENLTRDLLKKTDSLEKMVNRLEILQPEIVRTYQENLKRKIAEALEGAQMDEGRVIQEVTIYADRVAIDEELVRLHSHVKAVRDLLKSAQAVGRKLDFIVQEMNREANTVLSKSDDLEVTEIGIDMKTCIEKIREQVQNLE